MDQFFILVVIIVVCCFLVQLTTLIDKRIIRKIHKTAIDNKLEIINLRAPNKSDGKNPFNNTTVRIISSSILGISSETTYYKIATTKSNTRNHWIKITIVLFFFINIDWCEINYSSN